MLSDTAGLERPHQSLGAGLMGHLTRMLTNLPGHCRFSTEGSKTSGFSLWIYAVPTSSNSTRLIINAGLSPKASGASGGPKQTKGPISAVKTAAVRAFIKNKPM